MNIEINEKIFDKFPILESKRLSFRDVRNSDAEELFYMRNNDLVMEFLDTNKFKTINEAEEFIHNIIASFNNKESINWIIEDKKSNQIAGYFGYWRLDKKNCRAELGYALKPEFWGIGIMSETFEVLLDFAFNCLQVHSIEGNVNPRNENSIKVLEKFGFKKEAHFKENFLFNGKFLDSIIYSLIEPYNVRSIENA